jgi:hypothetical protein
MSRNRLAILPGLTHYDIFLSPLLPATVRPFLDGKASSADWAEKVVLLLAVGPRLLPEFRDPRVGGVKSDEILAWLKQDFALGHGHATAIGALLKGSKSQISK